MHIAVSEAQPSVEEQVVKRWMLMFSYTTEK